MGNLSVVIGPDFIHGTDKELYTKKDPTHAQLLAEKLMMMAFENTCIVGAELECSQVYSDIAE